MKRQEAISSASSRLIPFMGKRNAEGEARGGRSNKVERSWFLKELKEARQRRHWTKGGIFGSATRRGEERNYIE